MMVSFVFLAVSPFRSPGSSPYKNFTSPITQLRNASYAPNQGMHLHNQQPQQDPFNQSPIRQNNVYQQHQQPNQIPFNQPPNYQTNFQSQQDFYQTQKNNFIQEQTRRNSALKAFSSINGFPRTLKYQNNPFC